MTSGDVAEMGRDGFPPPPFAPPLAAAAGGGGDDDSERERQEIYNALFEEDDDDVSEGAGPTFFTDFPPLPDFSCMSSSSSSNSSTRVVSSPGGKPAGSTSTNSTSSSASSWAVLGHPPPQTAATNHHLYYQSDDQAAPPGALSSTASMEVSLPPPQIQPEDDIDRHLNACTDADECMNVMANFGYMDLLDNPEIWDPASIFQLQQQQQANATTDELPPPQQPPPQQPEQPFPAASGEAVCLENLFFIEGSAELSAMFLEWLRKNKDGVSAREVRSIKLKKHTLEAALRRLGCNREGKIKLLQLILQWVEHYQLPKNRHPGFDLNRNPYPDPFPQTPCSPWQPPPTPYPQTPQEYSYVNLCDINPFNSGGGFGFGSGNFYQPQEQEQYHHPSPMDCQMPPPWNVIPGQMMMAATPPPHFQFNPGFPDNNNVVHFSQTHQGLLRQVSQMAQVAAQPQAVFMNGYPYPVFDNNPNPNPTPNPNPNPRPRSPATAVADTLERLPRGDSLASKEARKKRMARHKRMLHHRHQIQNQGNDHDQVQDMVICEQQQQQVMMHGDVNIEDCSPSTPAGSWVLWHPVGAPPAATTGLVPAEVEPPLDTGTMLQNRSQSFSADRNKSEKNLKFLLQKVLKQSDVGNLGRIVLPKRESELHLPQLGSRDGITLTLEDIGNNGRVFNMRYRFWPNNKSRMYLLENTGEFVRTNELQEGDFIVIYSDAKGTKYMIRGVKVRGAKPEPKKPAAKKKGKLSPAPFEQPPEAAM